MIRDPKSECAGPSRAFLTSLHPSGDAREIMWIGEGSAPSATDGQADIVMLAMSGAECRDARRRAAMVERALSALGHDGVIWVDAPRRWRGALMSALGARGMTIGALTVRRARGAGETQLALTPRALRFALQRGHLSRRWRAVLTLLELPYGRGLLTRLLPGVGFAAFRPGTRPFGWLVDFLPDARETDVVLIPNWRGEQAPYLVFALGTGQTLVAKCGAGESKAQVKHESEMLKCLGQDLDRSGLDVPQLIDFRATSTLSTLIESGVTGRPLASLMREGRHRDLGMIADRLADWLAGWNRRTLRQIELTPELADRLILSPARALAESIDNGPAYLEWLTRKTGTLVGSEVPTVAAHNDLTMANLLGDTTAIRSVVDWEAASLDGLPLADFHYAVCDAAAAISGIDRLAAFRACFVDGGETLRRIQTAEAPLRVIAGESPEWLELCVHAGWLQHAADEQARSPSSRVDGSFLAIANLLANSLIA